MKKYRKLVVALLGAGISALAIFFGFDLATVGITAENIWAVLVPIATAIGVERVSNG